MSDVIERNRIRDYLSRHWYMYQWLTGPQREIVLDFTEGFCAHAEFFFSPAIDEREELSWLVGANAALVGGAQRTGCFSSVRWVYLLDDGVLEEERSGEAFGHTSVRINAHDLHAESFERIPGQQIAVHEFAHILDSLFGITDSTPGLLQGLEHHLANVRAGIDDGIPEDVVRVMIEEDSRVEFFSYMSELFFTDPHGVLDFYPPLYDDLVKIYGLDLARQMPDLADSQTPEDGNGP